MEDIIDIIVTETTNLIEITSQPTDEIIDVNIIDNREDITLNVTPSVVEININSLTGNFGVNWGDIEGTLSNQNDLQNVLNAKADLVDGKVPSSQLPSYVDDVVEVANYASLPVTGEVGKIYITLDTNFIYRWSGSTYVEIKDSSAVWGAITGTLSSQTDLQTALNAKFDDPTGDTTQYIAGDGSLITFPVAGQAGTLVREVRNTTGATLTKGTIVYISGATGNKPTVSKAIATGDSTSAQTFGMCQANISNNSNGYVVCVGDITGLDTSAVSEGVQLYLSSTTAGTYTTTKQYAPAHLVYIGVVTRSHPTQGQIEVKIQNGYELDEIHDVLITSKANNQGLFYESATSLWKNKSIATVLGYTPANGANYLPLTGGTLTGNLLGTNITISNSLIAKGGTFNGGASAGVLTIDGLGSDLLINRSNTSNGASITLLTDAVEKWNIGLRSTGTTDNFFIYNSNLTANALTINSATSASTFASSVTASALYVTGMTAGSGAIYHTGSRLTFANYNTSGTLHFEVNGGTGALTLNSNLSATFASTLSATGATFSGALSGTSATFTSLTTNGNGYHAINANITGGSYGTINISSSGNRRVFLGFSESANTYGTFGVVDDSGVERGMQITRATGAATFSSSVQATSIGVNTSPSYPLHILRATGSDYIAKFEHTSAAVVTQGVLINTPNDTSDTSFLLNVQSASTSRFVVKGNGNVGIGTTAPTNYSGRSALAINGSTSGGLLEFQYAGTRTAYMYAGSGELQIQTTSDITSSTILNLNSNGSSGILTLQTAGSERMRITSGGDTQIAAGKAIYCYGTDAKSYGWTNLADGNLSFTSVQFGVKATIGAFSGVYTPLSDINKKKEFELLTKGLESILGLKPTLYRYKDDVNNEYNKTLGFIAQEVNEFIPEAYVETGNITNKFIGLDYNAIVATLVKAVQEQQAQIEELKNK